MAGLRRRQALQALVLAPLAGAAGLAHGEGARWLPWPRQRATPALVLPEVDGLPWALEQLRGQPVLLNFWASWCEPCRAEMPALVGLETQLAATGLKVVAVNYKESADTVRRFRTAYGLPLVCLRDSYGEAARAWGVRSFPTSVLLDRTGRALLSVEGEVDWASADMQQRLAQRV